MASSESKFERDDFVGSVENLTMEDPLAHQVLQFGTRMRRKQRGSGNNVPLITLEPKVHHVFRYIRESGNTWNVDVGDVARAIVAAASATTYRYIMRTFRIKKVTIRGSIGAVGSQTTVSLRYLGANTNELRYQDSTFKVDSNAVVSRAPPKFSLASFWHDVTNDTLSTPLFELVFYGDGQCYIDVHLEFLIDVDRYVTFTLAGGTALNPGGLYKGSLTTGLIAVGGTRL